MTWSRSVAVRPASFNASLNDCSTNGRYACSPNRSSHCFEYCSPGTRQRSTNSPVASAPPMLSAITSSPSPISSATAASPPADSSAPPGRPMRMSDSTARPPRTQRHHDRRGSRTNRADAVDGARSGRQRRARHGSCWRWSCRGTPAQWSRTRRSTATPTTAPTRVHAAPPRPPSSRVLVVAGDAARAAPSAGAERRGDRGTLQPPVGHVDPVADDACHVSGHYDPSRAADDPGGPVSRPIAQRTVAACRGPGTRRRRRAAAGRRGGGRRSAGRLRRFVRSHSRPPPHHWPSRRHRPHRRRRQRSPRRPPRSTPAIAASITRTELRRRPHRRRRLGQPGLRTGIRIRPGPRLHVDRSGHQGARRARQVVRSRPRRRRTC